MNKQIEPSGFFELSHTADVALFVWAADLPTLLIQAAKGMNLIMGIKPAEVTPEPQLLHIPTHGKDKEEVLLAFLSELLFIVDVERMTFREIGITWGEAAVTVQMAMVPILFQKIMMKAATFHNLAIQYETNHYQVTIVFDI